MVMFSKPKFLREKIDHKEIYKILLKNFNVAKDQYFLYGITDKFFYTATKEEILDVIEEDKTNDRVYVAETGDCDNFAFELRAAFGRKGWPVGVLIIDTAFGLHAIFFFIDENKEVHTIEPQNDSVFHGVNSLIGVIMY